MSDCYNKPKSERIPTPIKIGYFENDADLLYQDEIHGSILEQVDKVLELIYTKYMRAKIHYEGVQKIERYFVPKDALRETLLNAICHKQYQYAINPGDIMHDLRSFFTQVYLQLFLEF